MPTTLIRPDGTSSEFDYDFDPDETCPIAWKQLDHDDDRLTHGPAVYRLASRDDKDRQMAVWLNDGHFTIFYEAGFEHLKARAHALMGLILSAVHS